MTSALCFYRLTFITAFHRRCQPLCARRSVLSKVVRAGKDGKRDIKRARARSRKGKVCDAVCVDGSSHGCVCPGFDTVQACCKTRANKDCVAV